MIAGLVSVITPTYNCGKFIGATIRSVLDQTYTNWEMIIVDDCSKDDTKTVVSSFVNHDNRIHYYCLTSNSGAAVARTTAMNHANGEYIAFLDSDDVWISNKLEKQLAFMKTHRYAFTCTAYEQITETGQSINKVFKPPKKINYNRLLLDCPVGNSTVMYSVEIMGKFEVPNIRKRNDDALWLRMLKKEQYIWSLPDVLTHYRVRSNSISSNKLDLIKYHWTLYRKIESLSFFRTIFHIGYWGLIKILKFK
ncbi:putative teichuronic acid biosynthesis glycosyltransferase TuaG [uncultured Spirochaetota bacterium]|jgi:glycosyltransferase involved in cell wall biosynthesis|nr:putative teichuronic acid biosynthesis glycosyltransferase TuaG [uncultured Spirochaetota bacterium]